MQFLLVIFVLASVQACLTLIQYKAIQKQFKLLKSKYPVISVGRTRGMFVRTAILAFDSSGILHEAFMLSGLTVFARLQRTNRFNGMNHHDIRQACGNKKNLRCVLQAIEYIEGQFNQRICEEVS